MPTVSTVMPDDKNGRENQARAQERRRQERAIAEELERWDETEPDLDESALGEVGEAVEALSFPATGTAVVEAVGDHEVASPAGTHTVAQLVPDTDEEVFESPTAVRTRVARPTVAASMKRIVEAKQGPDRDRFGSQRRAYEKTLRALAAVDADDDDEGVTAITDWIVGELREGNQPSSRNVRRRGATFCRERGYQISANDWLGV